MEESHECQICLDSSPLDTIEPPYCNLVKTKCNHVYHLDCISRWIAQCPLCPTCKRKIKISDLYADQPMPEQYTIEAHIRENELAEDINEENRQRGETYIQERMEGMNEATAFHMGGMIRALQRMISDGDNLDINALAVAQIGAEMLGSGMMRFSQFEPEQATPPLPIAVNPNIDPHPLMVRIRTIISTIASTNIDVSTVIDQLNELFIHFVRRHDIHGMDILHQMVHSLIDHHTMQDGDMIRIEYILENIHDIINRHSSPVTLPSLEDLRTIRQRIYSDNVINERIREIPGVGIVVGYDTVNGNTVNSIAANGNTIDSNDSDIGSPPPLYEQLSEVELATRIIADEDAAQNDDDVRFTLEHRMRRSRD